MKVIINCVKAYKTLELGIHNATCVKKEKPLAISYNSSYTTKWEECTWEECTSLAIKDGADVIRYYSRKNFKLK